MYPKQKRTDFGPFVILEQHLFAAGLVFVSQ